MSEETMDEGLVAMESEMDRAVMLDGNAAAGMLQAIFGGDMTAVPSQCDNCGDVAMMGTLHAYTQGPGMVLRCAICSNVVIRIVETPDEMLMDARGARMVRLPRER